MSGNASRMRRKNKRKQERAKERNVLGPQEMSGRFPTNGKGFYIWAETVTKFSYKRSPWLGPFRHVRLAGEQTFAGPHHEDEKVVAWFNGFRWVINHRNSNPDGYMEVLFSDHEPLRPQEETIPVTQDGNEASTADGHQVQVSPPV